MGANHFNICFQLQVSKQRTDSESIQKVNKHNTTFITFFIFGGQVVRLVSSVLTSDVM